MSHARLLIPDPRDSRWDTAHQRCIPIIPPRSVLTLRRHKAGQGHLKVHEMQHDRTSLTYACVTVEQIDDWWQSTMSSGEARKHSIRNTDFIALYLNVLLLFVSAQEKKKKKKNRSMSSSLKLEDVFISVFLKHGWLLHISPCQDLACPSLPLRVSEMPRTSERSGIEKQTICHVALSSTRLTNELLFFVRRTLAALKCPTWSLSRSVLSLCHTEERRRLVGI